MSAKNELIKISINAVAFGALLSMAAPGKNLAIMNGKYNIPTVAVGAGIGAGSTVLVDMVHKWVLPHISSDEKLANRETLLLAAGVAAGASAGALAILNPDALYEMGVGKFAGLAAGTELASHVAYEFVIGSAQ